MGFSQILKFFSTLFFFVFLLISSIALLSSSSSPTSTQIQHKALSQEPVQYRVFHIKNTPPFFLDDEEVFNKKKKRKKMMKKRKKIKNLNARPFSVMLPKGFNIPPSGSSPCHNGNPNSEVTLYCDLSRNAKP